MIFNYPSNKPFFPYRFHPKEDDESANNPVRHEKTRHGHLVSSHYWHIKPQTLRHGRSSPEDGRLKSSRWYVSKSCLSSSESIFPFSHLLQISIPWSQVLFHLPSTKPGQLTISIMGLFTRRSRDPATNGATNGHRHRTEKRRARKDGTTRRQPFDLDSGHFNRRPSFGQW
jgi:hypothetical protein